VCQLQNECNEQLDLASDGVAHGQAIQWLPSFCCGESIDVSSTITLTPRRVVSEPAFAQLPAACTRPPSRCPSERRCAMLPTRSVTGSESGSCRALGPSDTVGARARHAGGRAGDTWAARSGWIKGTFQGSTSIQQRDVRCQIARRSGRRRKVKVFGRRGAMAVRRHASSRRRDLSRECVDERDCRKEPSAQIRPARFGEVGGDGGSGRPL
jgi:hypothetical protein